MIWNMGILEEIYAEMIFFLHFLIRTIDSDQENCCELTKKKMIFLYMK
jgi:hypothetical protein